MLEIFSGACKLLSFSEERLQESISVFNATFHLGIICRTLGYGQYTEWAEFKW